MKKLYLLSVVLCLMTEMYPALRAVERAIGRMVIVLGVGSAGTVALAAL